MTDIVARLVGLANSLGGDDEDVIMAGVADNERLRKCICDMYGIWRNAAEEREAEIAQLRAALQAMLDCHGKPHRADWISDAAYQHAVEVDAQACRALEPRP